MADDPTSSAPPSPTAQRPAPSSPRSVLGRPLGSWARPGWLTAWVSTWWVVGLGATHHSSVSPQIARWMIVGIATIVTSGSWSTASRTIGLRRSVLLAAGAVSAVVALRSGGEWAGTWIAAGALLAWVGLPLDPRSTGDRSMSAVIALAGAAIATWLAGPGAATWQPLVALVAATPLAAAAVDRAGPLHRLVAWAVPVGRRVAVALGRGEVVVAVVMAVLAAPIYWRLAADPSVVVRGVNDYQGHVERAEWIRFWPPRVASPHFVYQVLIRLLWPWVGVPAAVTAVLSTSTGVMAAVVYRLGRRPGSDGRSLGRAGAMALPFAYLFSESPALLVPTTWGAWGRYPSFDANGTGPGFVELHVWGSPTGMLLLPFAFLQLLVLLDVFDRLDRDDVERWRPWSLAAVTLVGTAVKPALMLSLIPAVAVFVVLSGRLRAQALRILGLWFALPGLGVIAFQVWFLRSGVSPYEQTSWQVNPFWIIERSGVDRPVTWVVVAFLGLCLWGGGRQYLREPMVQLCWIAVVIALVPAFVFQETGDKARDGNLAQTLFFSLVLLVVVSMRHMGIRLADVWHAREEGVLPPLWAYCLASFGTLMLVAGVAAYLDAAGVLRVA